jgi:hypothetical protein
MTPTEKREFHVKWLKFAIRLSQTNFEELKEGQRLDLKNEYREFLSTAEDRQLRRADGRGLPHVWNVISRVRGDEGIPEMVRDLAGEKDLDEVEAKKILAGELVNLAGGGHPNVGMGQFQKMEGYFGIGRDSDSFYLITSHKKASARLLNTFGNHLVGSAITPSMLRRCPTCKQIFLTSRKPRTDRELHCSLKCSSRAASTTYNRRVGRLKYAKNLIAEGKTGKLQNFIDGLNRKGDRDWLMTHLKEMSSKTQRSRRAKRPN